MSLYTDTTKDKDTTKDYDYDSENDSFEEFPPPLKQYDSENDSYSSVESIIMSGDIDSLKYAHSHGLINLSDDVCIIAASALDLECLRYCHEHGCSIGARVYEEIVNELRPGMLPILQYVFENGTDTRMITHRLQMMYPDILSSSRTDMKMLKYIHEFIGVSFSMQSVYIKVKSPQDFKVYDKCAWLQCRVEVRGDYPRLDYLIQHGVIYKDPMSYYSTKNETFTNTSSNHIIETI